MRIISGKFRGRRFDPPTNITARPTTDFAKENLFNVLNNLIDFEDIDVLDLFSGTGSISYEFASRGARYIKAIEMSERHIAFIKKTVSTLKIDNIEVNKMDVFRFLNSSSQKFDIVFADPPYQMEGIEKLPDAVFANDRLNEDGLFILEHGKGTSFSEHSRFIEERTYGNVHFSLFQ